MSGKRLCVEGRRCCAGLSFAQVAAVALGVATAGGRGGARPVCASLFARLSRGCVLCVGEGPDASRADELPWADLIDRRAPVSNVLNTLRKSHKAAGGLAKRWGKGRRQREELGLFLTKGWILLP